MRADLRVQRDLLRGLNGLVLCLTLPVAPLGAQAGGAPGAHGGSPGAARGGAPLSGPADTLLVPGRQEFSHYTTPGMCLRAAVATELSAHFADEDTAAYTARVRTPLAAATVTLARRCGARFTVATTAPADQLDLLRLALFMGDDTLARAAGARYVAAARDPEAQRWALYALDTAYLSARPMRVTAAEAVAAQLDSLGPAAALQRAKVHAELLLQARLRYDLAAMEREAVATVAADNQLTAADRTLWEGGDGGGGDAATVLFFLELYRDPKDVVARTAQRLQALGYTQWRADMPLPFGLDRGLAQIGKLAPPLKADYWVGADSAAHTWPVPGKVSVYLISPLNVAEREDAWGLQTWAQQEASRMAIWRRLLTQYGPALSVTVLVKARGSFQDGPPLAPEEEARRIGQFYREELKVPVTVAVQTTPIKQLPDGRRVRGHAAYQQDPYYSEKFLLADRAGRVLLAIPSVPPDEAMLSAWIARAVGR